MVESPGRDLARIGRRFFRTRARPPFPSPVVITVSQDKIPDLLTYCLRTIRSIRPFPGGRRPVRGPGLLNGPMGGFRRTGNRAARRSQGCNCGWWAPSICRSLTLLRAGPQREKSAGPLREEPHGTPPASPRVGWRASCKARRSEVCVPAVQRRSPLDPARAARRPRPRPTAQTGEP